MSSISEVRMRNLLAPYFDQEVTPRSRRVEGQLTHTPREELYPELALYLDLLLRWNARTNLTAIRDSETIVQRHFGESLFAGRWLAQHTSDGDQLLDFGSGAGFPGFPIQLLYPKLRVTLAESQGKKAAFLRELVRAFNMETEIWAERVEKMPSERQFEAVALRAVDDVPRARDEARLRVRRGGWFLELSTSSAANALCELRMPGLHAGVLRWEQIR